MTPVATLVAQLRALKPIPDAQIVVSAITGPSTPYTDPMAEPAPAGRRRRGRRCRRRASPPTPALADPAIRIGAFVDAFGGNGVRLSICDDSFTPALQTIAGRIAERITP